MQLFQRILVINILKSKFFIWTIIPLIILGILILVYFSSISDFTVFPNKNNNQFIFYTDHSIGGNSQITDQIVNDSIIKIDFKLKDSIECPYVGVSIAPNVDSTVNLAYYNQIRLKVSGHNINNIGVALFAPNLSADASRQSPEINYYTTLGISSEISQYILPVDMFKVPDWWNETNNSNRSPNLKINLKQLTRLNIGNAYTPKIGEKQSIEIHSIALVRDNKPLTLLILGLEFTIIFFMFSVLFLIEKFKASKNSITINYRPVESDVKKDSKSVFIDYINNNFQNNQLTIESVSKETGISQRKITNYIQQQFTCNYKTYLNRLRINESKRLLIETELNIGEVAFKVGFNNQTHFNRVFKTETGVSPTEFREKTKNPK
jgi:AraC-like DNA-binding protein